MEWDVYSCFRKYRIQKRYSPIHACSGNNYVVLSTYVDDVLLLRVDPNVEKTIREQLMNKISVTNLGSASLALGMEIERGEGFIKAREEATSSLCCANLTFTSGILHRRREQGSHFLVTRKGAVFLDMSGIKRYQEMAGTLMYLVNNYPLGPRLRSP